MECLETNVVSVYQRETSSSEAGGWEDKVEVSNEVPSLKETVRSRARLPRGLHGGLTLPALSLGLLELPEWPHSKRAML